MTMKPRSKIIVLFLSVFAFFLALLMLAIPFNKAMALGEITAHSATSTITVYLQGNKTSNKLNVPVSDASTADYSVAIVENYSMAYSIDYTLQYDDEKGNVSNVYTKTTTVDRTTPRSGTDSWTLDVVRDAGTSYGTYILKSVVSGTGKQTDSAKWRYVPIWGEFVEKGDNSDPKFLAYYDYASVKRVKWTVSGGRLASNLAGVIDLANENGDITIPLADYTLDANDYTLTLEGLNSSNTSLDYTYSTTFHYSGSTTPPTPDTNGDGDGALLVAAGAAIAVSAKKRRSS